MYIYRRERGAEEALEVAALDGNRLLANGDLKDPYDLDANGYTEEKTDCISIFGIVPHAFLIPGLRIFMKSISPIWYSVVKLF